MPRGASPKRERQYEHIKDSAQQRGESPKRGESRTASKTSTQDISPGAAGPTKEQLYAEARKRTIKGRSSMTKAQLEKALSR